jgi:hypothetical protein
MGSTLVTIDFIFAAPNIILTANPT